MNSQKLCKIAADALDDMKALNVVQLDVQHLTTMTDQMLIASGRSDRHVRSLASSVVAAAKEAGFKPVGMEGEESGEWVLVDLNGVIVHVMQQKFRDFYQLEQLWGMKSADSESAADISEG